MQRQKKTTTTTTKNRSIFPLAGRERKQNVRVPIGEMATWQRARNSGEERERDTDGGKRERGRREKVAGGREQSEGKREGLIL